MTPQVTWKPWNPVIVKNVEPYKPAVAAPYLTGSLTACSASVDPSRKPRRETMSHQLDVLDDLHTHERRAGEDRDQQPQLEPPLVALGDRGERLHHRHRGADQQERVEGVRRDLPG